MLCIEYGQVCDGKDGGVVFIEQCPADNSCGIEPQVLCEKAVYRLSFGRAEVVVLAREMDILHVRLHAIPAIDLLDIGIFQPRAILGPVAVVRDEQHGTRRRQGSNLNVVGQVRWPVMDGHAAFADAAPKKCAETMTTGAETFTLLSMAVSRIVSVPPPEAPVTAILDVSISGRLSRKSSALTLLYVCSLSALGIL